MEIPILQEGGTFTNSNDMFVEQEYSEEIILRKTDMPNIICESHGNLTAKELPHEDKLKSFLYFETLNTIPED